MSKNNHSGNQQTAADLIDQEQKNNKNAIDKNGNNIEDEMCSEVENKINDIEKEIEEIESRIEEELTPPIIESPLEKILKEQIEILECKSAETREQLLKIVAEYENYRKRTAKEKEDIGIDVKAETIGTFLPVLDNFERALQFDFSSEDFAKGIIMIEKNFVNILESLGLEEIGEVGEKFDPNLHNAIMHIEDETFAESVVSKVMQKGYKIGEKVVRYAVVETAN